MQRNPFKQAPSKRNEHQRKGDFGKKRGFRNSLSTKEKDWGKNKFTPIPRSQPATPWATFKNDILQKQQEDINAEKNLNMETKEAQQFVKRREENYRRTLIMESQTKPTKWEDFSEDVLKERSQSKHHKRGKASVEKLDQNPFVKTRKPNLPIIERSILKNFDSKKLNFEQNNALRKAITKTTHLARGATLKSVVEDMKRHGVKKGKTKSCSKQ